MRLTMLLLVLAEAACAQATRTLDIYVIDVEGGNATLLVGPSRESLLIDTGNAGAAAARDAGRIVEAIHDAGIEQIDHLITTHWHGDHFGGMAELARQVPIREFIDHGPNVQPGELADNFLAKTYPPLYANAKHTVAKPGDRIAVAHVSHQPARHRRRAFGLASWRQFVELRGDGARAASARGNHEQRHAKRWRAGRDDGGALLAWARRPVAASFFAAERPGVHRTWDVHR